MKQNSASDALVRTLRLTFNSLRVLIVLLLIGFIFSGSFFVRENEQAIILRFGKVISGPEGALRKSGSWHWAWPAPIDKIIRIPVTQNIEITSEKFWYSDEFANADETYTGEENELVSGRDGYLLTGDINLLHLKTTAICRVTDPFKYHFFANEADRESLLQSLMNQIVVQNIASQKVDDALYRNVGNLETKLQKEFNQKVVNLGLTVIDFKIEQKAPPRAVLSSFSNVLSSELEKDQTINEANAYAERLVTEASGKASKVLSTARVEKQRQLSELEADAKYFEAIYKEYRQHPKTTLLSLYNQVLGDSLTQAEELFVLPADEEGSSELRLLLSKEPKK